MSYPIPNVNGFAEYFGAAVKVEAYNEEANTAKILLKGCNSAKVVFNDLNGVPDSVNKMTLPAWIKEGTKIERRNFADDPEIYITVASRSYVLTSEGVNYPLAGFLRTFRADAWEELSEEPEPQPQPEPQPEPAPTPKATNNTLDALSQVFAGVADTVTVNVMAQIKPIIEQYRPVVHVHRVEFKGKTTEVKGHTHMMFEKVLRLITLRRSVYLWGPAGTGKSFLAEQIAEALSLPYHFVGKILVDDELTGHPDINGNFVKTPFYDGFTGGGIFCADELDGSCPEAALKLNSALAQRSFNFPVIGNQKANDEFFFVATGNTPGMGADELYCTRQPLDASLLNRCVSVYIDYDPAIEELKAEGDKDILTFIRGLRKSAEICGTNIILSYRNIDDMATLAHDTSYKWGAKDIVEMCVTKGLNHDICQQLYTNLAYDAKNNIYATALNNI